MVRVSSAIGLAVLFSIGGVAATVNTTLTASLSGSITGTGLTGSGPATLTGIGTGTIAGSIDLTAVSGSNYIAPFTITLTTGDKITGQAISICGGSTHA